MLHCLAAAALMIQGLAQGSGFKASWTEDKLISVLG
jgi:hypothetical protein